MLETIKQIVHTTGDLIRDVRAGSDDINSKEGRANYVTKYDVMVQAHLFQELSKAFPDASFVGEESTEVQQVGAGYTFIVDPIDGTTNFINDFHYSAISVALALDGQIVIGVVYNPYTEEMYWAERGKGAYLNGRRLEPITRPLSEGLVCFGTSTYYPELSAFTLRLAAIALEKSMDFRRLGAASLDLCYLAAGRNVLFYEMVLSCWDYAAAWLVLEEVGGILTTMDGTPTDLNKKGSILAGTPAAYEEFLSIIQETKRQGGYHF